MRCAADRVKDIFIRLSIVLHPIRRAAEGPSARTSLAISTAALCRRTRKQSYLHVSLNPTAGPAACDTCCCAEWRHIGSAPHMVSDVAGST